MPAAFRSMPDVLRLKGFRRFGGRIKRSICQAGEDRASRPHGRRLRRKKCGRPTLQISIG